MVPVSGHAFTTAGQPLTTFYENAGTTEFNWNQTSPDKTRMGILRSSTGSILNNKVIKRASFKMRRIGSKPSTTVYCRIYHNTADGSRTGSLVRTLGSKPFDDIPTTATRVEFEDLANTYQMTTDDAIVIESTVDSTNTLVMYHSTDAVDGSNTQRISYDNQWKWISEEDADAKLEG